MSPAPAAAPRPAVLMKSRLFIVTLLQLGSGRLYAPGRGDFSVSRDRHPLDEDRTAGARAARERVRAYRRYRAEHVAQVAGDGDLLHRVPDLSALHPVARRAARVVAGDEVYAEADQLGDKQPPAHLADQAGEVELAALQDEVVIAARAAGGLHAELARGVASQEIAAQDAVLDHVAVARGDTFVVVPRARRRPRQVR